MWGGGGGVMERGSEVIRSLSAPLTPLPSLCLILVGCVVRLYVCQHGSLVKYNQDIIGKRRTTLHQTYQSPVGTLSAVFVCFPPSLLPVPSAFFLCHKILPLSFSGRPSSPLPLHSFHSSSISPIPCSVPSN